MFTVLGEMQNICAFFKRCVASMIPIVIAAGNAGGTTMVNKSNASNAISRAVMPRKFCKTVTIV
jgi:hypothetical protein